MEYYVYSFQTLYKKFNFSLHHQLRNLFLLSEKWLNFVLQNVSVSLFGVFIFILSSNYQSSVCVRLWVLCTQSEESTLKIVQV